MIKNYVLLALVIVTGSASAKDPCADLRGEQSYPPLDIRSGTVCFVREPVLDAKTGESVGLDGISLYYIANGDSPKISEGRGLLYDDTPGEIVDAFPLDVGGNHQEKIFVIHSMEVRSSLVESNSSGKFYSVSVYEPIGNVLRQDERSTDWFGGGYSWLSDGRRVIYKFPYQYRRDVRQAIDSPFALFMSGGGSVPVAVKYKTSLYEESNVISKTKKYLISGDRSVVEKFRGGWCKINYVGVAKPINMWVMCSAIEPNFEGRKRGGD